MSGRKLLKEMTIDERVVLNHVEIQELKKMSIPYCLPKYREYQMQDPKNHNLDFLDWCEIMHK